MSAASLRGRMLLQRALAWGSSGRTGCWGVAGAARTPRHTCAAAAVGAGQLQLHTAVPGWGAGAGAAGTACYERLLGGGADPLAPFHLGAAARLLASAAQQQQQPAKGGKQEEAFDSLELTDEKISAITDKIPQRPVGVVEGTSYSAVILAAFGCLAYFVYNFVVTLVLEPVQQQCFNTALERLRADPRITVRLGASITGYGQETSNRSARSIIPHQVYKDAEGRDHVRLQFHMRGAGGTALVSADMYKPPGSGEWEYTYLIADVAAGGGPTQRLNIIVPR